MELKKLEYLEAIYRHRNFTKAAEEHYISQPSITNAIKALEDEMGCTLIERKSKPLKFTSKGELFMKHVYIILNAVKDAEEEMQGLSKPETILLNVGFGATARNWFVPKIYTEFQDMHPEVNVALQENTTSIMLEQLSNESLDLLFTLLPDSWDFEKFESIPIAPCELGVLLPPDHPLTEHDRIPIESISTERLLTFPPGALIKDKLEKTFNSIHLSPRIQTVAQLSVAEKMAAVGYGVTFTTRELAHLNDIENGLTFRPFNERILFMQCIMLKRNRPKTQAMQWMISYILDSSTK
jgi:DNA-binding transcriptional LysR family regulator